METESVPRHSVDVEQARTLRPLGTRIFVVGALVCLAAIVELLVDVGPAHTVLPAVPLLLAGLYWFWQWYRVGVCVRRSGLVVRGRYSDPEIRWGEVTGVRLEWVRTRGVLKYYGPMLELRSGEEMLLHELTSPALTWRPRRSLPGRQVATIERYLRDDQPNDLDDTPTPTVTAPRDQDDEATAAASEEDPTRPTSP